MRSAIQCKKHPKARMIIHCSACLGAITSPAKAKASRRNGTLGGRPRKERLANSEKEKSNA